MTRRTKIVATIGPSSRSPEILEQLVKAGMDCARLNFSHGTHRQHGEVIHCLRSLSSRHGRPLSILQDLGGGKLRLGRFKGHHRLQPGDEIALSSDKFISEKMSFPFPYPEILAALKINDQVYISDGSICLEVVRQLKDKVLMRVARGGVISSSRGVNILGLSLESNILTEPMKAAIRFGIENEVDWLAVSFVRSAQDLTEIRSYVRDQGGSLPLMAKLERGEALLNMDSILDGADAVMVARGDLGIETPMARLPLVQTEIVRAASIKGVTSVIATQMLSSMVVAPVPTRAEVTDVSKAVLDGCDAILLSDETAIGQNPVEAVKVAVSIIEESETAYPFNTELPSNDRTQSIAAAGTNLARDLGSQIIVLTRTGRAAQEVSRFRPKERILVLCHDESMQRRLCLVWGLTPLGVIPVEKDIPKLVSMVVNLGVKKELISTDDVVTIVHGFLTGVAGTTNTLQVLDLKEYLPAIKSMDS
ncbi:MAG: pyruvate kinase [SAR202 cluster bacterium]|nr:pyruvate kinase [SAR202 cluster bacterium]